MLTDKVELLVVEYSLHSHNVRLDIRSQTWISKMRTTNSIRRWSPDTRHYGNKYLVNCEFQFYVHRRTEPTCSFIVKGPGLRCIPKILTRGMACAHARPNGNTISCATSYGSNKRPSGIFKTLESPPKTHASNDHSWVTEVKELI